MNCPKAPRPFGPCRGTWNLMDERALRRHRPWKVAVAAALLLLAACGKSDPEAGAGEGGRGPKGPIQVGYVVVQPGSAPLQQQLPARVAAYQVSEVRPQVSGVIQLRLF